LIDILFVNEYCVQECGRRGRQTAWVRAVPHTGRGLVRLETVPADRVRKRGEMPKPQKHERVDRRVQRSRQLLQDALIAMMIEKGYEATTVQDIIDRANVGRATLHAHFADQETLLTSRLEDLRGLLIERQRQAPGFGL